jgi:hypothetical protein
MYVPLSWSLAAMDDDNTHSEIEDRQIAYKAINICGPSLRITSELRVALSNRDMLPVGEWYPKAEEGHHSKQQA